MDIKVGNKVKVKSRQWYHYHADIDGCVVGFEPFGYGKILFVPAMERYCGKECIVSKVDGYKFRLEGCGDFWFHEYFVEPVGNGSYTGSISLNGCFMNEILSCNRAILNLDAEVEKICIRGSVSEGAIFIPKSKELKPVLINKNKLLKVKL